MVTSERRARAPKNDDSHYQLDDMLADWHRWSSGYSPVAAHGSCAMFTEVKSGRQDEYQYEINAAAVHKAEMKNLDFHVMELPPDQRTAIQIQARNLATGKSVWRSARLPEDLEARTEILVEARARLMQRLNLL